MGSTNIPATAAGPGTDDGLGETIRGYFRDDRSRMTMMAARKFGVPERAVVEALVGHWPVVPLRDDAFRPLLDELPALGTMRVFVRSRAAVIESVGVFGGISETGPFLNVQTDTLDMHILHEEIGAVYSVEKVGHDSTFVTHSFQFFDKAGDAAFKAFLWENFPDVPAERVAAFQALTRRFAAKGRLMTVSIQSIILFAASSALASLWVVGVTHADGGEAPSLPADLLPPGSSLTVAARTSFLEGPAFDADGTLYFSDLIGNRILTMTPAGVVSVFRPDSGRTNGNTFDAQGRLVSCEGAEQGPGGRRRVVRTDLKAGRHEVLTDRFEGKRYNAPNDVCVDAKGRVWFTDPYYGEDRASLEMTEEAVYRIDPDGSVRRMVSQPTVERPNGLAVTPDMKTLYLIDSHPRPGGNRKVWAFPLADDGTPGAPRLVYDFGRGRGGDGMRLDVNGNLWVAAGIAVPRTSGETADVAPGVYVITPVGKLLGRVPIPEDVITNLAFGGHDRKTLHVVAGKSVFRIAVGVAGYALYPPVKE